MAKNSRGPPKKALWAYAYDITMPETEEPLQSIQDLLDQEHTEARDGGRTWGGRVVVEPRITRILVVSDSPAQDGDANRRLEAALKLLKATFAITAPLAVAEEAASRTMNGGPPNGGPPKRLPRKP